MEISRTDIHGILQAYYSKKGRIQPLGTDEEKKGDNITLSSEGLIFQKALDRLKEEPEVREQLISDLREKILGGQYVIEGDVIARQMVEDLLSDNFTRRI